VVDEFLRYPIYNSFLVNFVLTEGRIETKSIYLSIIKIPLMTADDETGANIKIKLLLQIRKHPNQTA